MAIGLGLIGGSDFAAGTKADAPEMVSTTNLMVYLSKLTGVNALNSQFYLPFNENSDTVTLNTTEIHHFSSFTLSGGTLTTDSASTTKSPLVIIVYGNATLSGGTIDLSGKGLSAGAGGAASGEHLDGTIGTGSTKAYYTTLVANGGTGGTGNGASATVATNYTNFDTTERCTVSGEYWSNLVVGSGGGGGESGGGADNGAGGAGGAGGGTLILICFGDLNVNGTTINTSGGAGTVGGTAAGAHGGGGGGGGGSAGNILLAYTGSYTSGATHTNTAGAAGASGPGGGSDTGGSGGAGASGTASNGSNGAAASGDDGGAGGAGGTGTLYTLDLDA